MTIHKGRAGDLLDRVMSNVPRHLNLCVLHALTEHHFDEAEYARVRQALVEVSRERVIHVAGFEWPRYNYNARASEDVHLTLTRYSGGRSEGRLLATSDRRGNSTWLQLEPSVPNNA